MKILEPMQINGMLVPNRIVVPAMVTRLSGEDGAVNQAIVDRYVRYAEGGVGLIVVEAMAVHGNKSGPLLRIGDDAFIPGHREMTDRVHDASGSKVVAQIIHFLKVARSGWRQEIESLSSQNIEDIIVAFGEAAARARDAGYDGVELHAAHAYTLASFLSRLNRRQDEYSGRTLEGRLRLLSRVLAQVRRTAGADYPVGVRFLVDEAIKDGYTVVDAKAIALRLAQLGADYLSLSVGGKFQDAVHREGQPLYPYTGYSGDRCMPGNWHPSLIYVRDAAVVKAYINERGFTTPVITAGKISTPAEAESILRDAQADMVAMARQILTDPDWVRKVEQNRQDEIVTCIYCNVCKKLDENFREVTCFLWPKGHLQAPHAQTGAQAPHWDGAGSGAPVLKAASAVGEITLTWQAAQGAAAGYDIYRVDGHSEAVCLDGVKGTRFIDRSVVGGMRYRYHVKAYDTSGRCSPPSNTVDIDLAMPKF